MSTARECRRERGATLFVGLIMLLLVTLMAIAAMRMATTNVQVVGNEQFHNEAQAAANFVLDQVVNDPNFVADYPKPNIPVNVGQATYNAAVTKVDCKRARTIRQAELVTKVGGQDTILPNDVPCITGQSQSPLTIAASGINPAGASLCAMALWDVQAEVGPHPVSGAKATMNDGIETRMVASDVATICK